MKRKIIVTLFILLVLTAGFAWWVADYLVKQAGGNAPSPYSVVTMTNGDIYFGRLSWSRGPHLANVWVLQRDPNGQISLNQFTRSVWGPTDELYLNNANIVSWARLSADSQIARAFANPQSVTQQQNVQMPSGNSAPAPTAITPTSTPSSGSKK